MDLILKGGGDAVRTKCPPGTTLAAVVQQGILSNDEILNAVNGLPEEEQWEAQAEVMKVMNAGEATDDNTGALLHDMAALVKSTGRYKAHLTEDQLMEQYHGVFQRAEEYGNKRDEPEEEESRQRITRLWQQPWIEDWLDTYGNTRTLQEEIFKVAEQIDFGTAVLLVNQAALSRVHHNQLNPSQGRSNQVRVITMDWTTVSNNISTGIYTPVITGQDVLSAGNARLGRYYLVEDDIGNPSRPCNEAWDAAIVASTKYDSSLQADADIVMADIGLAFAFPTSLNPPPRIPSPQTDPAPSSPARPATSPRLPMVMDDFEEVLSHSPPNVPLLSDVAQDLAQLAGPLTERSAPASSSISRHSPSPFPPTESRNNAVHQEETEAAARPVMSHAGLAFTPLENPVGGTMLDPPPQPQSGEEQQPKSSPPSPPSSSSSSSDADDEGGTARMSAPYAFISQRKINVNSHAILNRFYGDLQKPFHQNGFVTTNQYGWLLDDLVMRKMIDSEFNCYRWHQDSSSFTSTSAVSRIMTHSLVQQLIRQDPVQYSLHVALRPDHHAELISYPCGVKYAYPGSLHMTPEFTLNTDLIKNMIDTGRGGNMIQAAVAMDEEDDNNCSEIGIGLHKHMAKGHDLATHRDSPSDGVEPPTTLAYFHSDAKALHLPHYDRFPCHRGDIRFSMPFLPHRQTGVPDGIRRVIYPCLIAVRKNGTLEDPRFGTVRSIAESHLKLTHPNTSPLYPVDDSIRGLQRFPPAVELRGLGPLSNALIGQVSWTSPAVRAEAAFYVDGTCSEEDLAAKLTVWRQRAKEQYTRAFQVFEQEERRVFGTRSFFYHMDGRSEPDFKNRPPCDPR